MKNIIVCSDGTGNSDIKGRGTNVFKLYEAVNLHDHEANSALPRQVAFYDDGVGTEDKWLRKVIGGAIGLGLSANVKRLYADIVRVHDCGSDSDPADKLFLFGFSRGAHTVRTLGGLIATCGLLDRTKFKSEQALQEKVEQAYALYRGKFRALIPALFRPRITQEDIEAFKRENCFCAHSTQSKDLEIEFIGVWDTVDAVGFPMPGIATFWNKFIWQFKFSDTRLSKIVQCARHALSMDDERLTFHPTLWNESDEDKQRTPPRIEQVWFSGVHTNVGGGYPKQGMSLVTLNWMMAEAEKRGLRFIPEDRIAYRERRNVHDKLYDSRAGHAAFYRYQPRDIAALCRVNSTEPKINLSVLERIAQGTLGYAPVNLPNHAKVVATRPFSDSELAKYTNELRELKPDLLKQLHAQIQLRFYSNFVFFLGVLGLVIAAACNWSSLTEFVWTWLPDRFIAGVPYAVHLVVAAALGAVIALFGWVIRVITANAKERMERAASECWTKFRLGQNNPLMD